MSADQNAIPFWLVIPAAGSSKRMGTRVPKQYQMLANLPLLQCTLDVFLPISQMQGIVVALHADDQQFAQLPAAKHPLVQTVIGGAERSDSVRLALDHLAIQATHNDWVLVHDAARPLVEAHDIIAMLQVLAASKDGGIMAIPVSDTIKQVTDSTITATHDRSQLWQAQTPQMFRLGALLSALQTAQQKNIVITDEASAMEAAGYTPQVFAGKRSNIKITVPEDWQLAEALLVSRGNSMTSSQQKNLPRIGHGYDVHRFSEPCADAFVRLGGVKIPHHKKLIAHSDGDVLIHALCDALLGAAALGDIGKHFPDTDNSYRNIDSRMLLRKVVTLLQEKRYSIGNVDVTVVAQTPKLLPHVPTMRTNLASDLGIDVDRVNVKATTTEKLGFEGREEGISCNAVAMIHAM
jgi:2-C-methyl-D-erythritol 4-phosphate cytidylyltransferase/2-C-methyl-D-erythritol 2,4-cyclodiphosphate synthase